MSVMRRRRFWAEASLVPAAAGFGVTLDGRPIRTPAGAVLELPTRALAEAVAAEWRGVEAEIEASRMPITRLANSAIDKVRGSHGEIAAMLSGYGATDLVCYRAGGPQSLSDRQAAAWDPLLAWLRTELDVRLRPVTGVMFRAQDQDALARLHDHVARLDDFELMAFHDLVTLTGSLVIALAVAERHLPAAEAWERSRVDETWQIEQWGEDPDATVLAEAKRADFHHAVRFLSCTREGR
ncbi:MAG: ATP12 family chaperone protein [Paracoccaceae bacterium]